MDAPGMDDAPWSSSVGGASFAASLGWDSAQPCRSTFRNKSSLAVDWRALNSWAWPKVDMAVSRRAISGRWHFVFHRIDTRQ